MYVYLLAGCKATAAPETRRPAPGPSFRCVCYIYSTYTVYVRTYTVRIREPSSCSRPALELESGTGIA